MAIIRQFVCIRNVWRLASTLNYINILQPVYFNVFFHGNLISCTISFSLFIKIQKTGPKVDILRRIHSLTKYKIILNSVHVDTLYITIMIIIMISII